MGGEEEGEGEGNFQVYGHETRRMVDSDFWARGSLQERFESRRIGSGVVVLPKRRARR